MILYLNCTVNKYTIKYKANVCIYHYTNMPCQCGYPDGMSPRGWRENHPPEDGGHFAGGHDGMANLCKPITAYDFHVRYNKIDCYLATLMHIMLL